MKFSVLQKNFASGLAVVNRAVATKSTLPILSNVLITATDSGLRLSATNLESAISTTVGAKVTEAGSITIPARLLTELIASLPDERIDVVVNAKFVAHIECGRTNTNIKGIDAADFPDIPVYDESVPSVQIDNVDLKKMLSMTVFAAAADEPRPVLAGVLLSIKDGTMTLAATDGFRLSVKSMRTNNQDVSVIIPAKSLSNVMRLMEGETTNIVISKNQVLFHSGNTDMTSRLIEGTFPNYIHIIPASSVTKTTVKSNDFLAAVQRASIFARESANIVRLDIQEGDDVGRISVTATSAEVGDSVNEIDASVVGSNLSICFNGRYLVDVLSETDETITLETNTATNPCVIKNEGDETFLHVIMPLQLPK